MTPSIVEILVESVSATVAIAVVILFLKYIKSRDQKDVEIYNTHKETITTIVKTHDDRVEILINKLP